MTECIFLAGASGVIGRALAPLLIAGGWRVVGTTRSPEKAEALRAAAVEPVIVDVYDRAALRRAVERARPAIVLHQLTDLSLLSDPARANEARERNTRIRDEGTRNLVAAALAAGARRMIAQSIAFAYADGPTPHRESDPLAIAVPGSAGITARGVARLEQQVLAAPLQGLILRYGRLYGPGTGRNAPVGPAPLHVSAAADATLRTLTRGEPGIYNIAEDDGAVDCEKARRQLGWTARPAAP